MPDTDSPWLMHMVSLCYQTIIIRGEVQIEGDEVSGEKQPVGYLSHELSGSIKANSEQSR